MDQDVDPEVISFLSQLDVMVNNLSLLPHVDSSKISGLQRRRASLDNKINNFKREMERKKDSFKSSILSEIKNLNDQVTSIQSGN